MYHSFACVIDIECKLTTSRKISDLVLTKRTFIELKHILQMDVSQTAVIGFYFWLRPITISQDHVRAANREYLQMFHSQCPLYEVGSHSLNLDCERFKIAVAVPVSDHVWQQLQTMRKASRQVTKCHWKTRRLEVRDWALRRKQVWRMRSFHENSGAVAFSLKEF